MDHNGLQRPSLPGKTVVPGQSSIYASGPLNLSKSKSLDLIQTNDNNNLDNTFDTFNLTMPPDMNYHHQQQQPLSPDLSLGLLPPQVKQATAAREKALQKMLNRVPFNVREDVTALVTMSVTLAESSQYNLQLSRQDLAKLKIELRKKTIEAENLRKSCEIFRERIRVTEDTIMQAKDALNAKQKFEIKSRRSVTRLAANNRMLIESLEALNVSKSSKNNKRLTNGDNSGNNSRPRSPLLLPISRESERNNDDNSESSDEEHVEDPNDKGVSSDKLRTSLLRVAREHYKKVKYVELLEDKMEELRSNLMNSERLNRKLKSEIDDLKSLYAGSQVLSTASIEKTEKEKKEEKEQKKVEEVDRPKKNKKNADEKFRQILAREGADYTEVLLQYRRIASYFSQAPLALTMDEVGQYLGSSEAIKALDVEMVAVFILDGPKKDKALRYTTRSPHPETHSKDVRSIASDVIKNGRIVRLNNLHRVPSFRQEIDGTPCTITRKILSVPIRSVEDKTVILGAIHLTNNTGAKGFTEVDEVAAQIFASYAGTLIDMYRHREATLNSNDLLSMLLDSSIQLYNIVPDSSSFASTKGLNVGEILHHLENISMTSLKCLKCRAFLASNIIDGNTGYMTYLEPSYGTSVKPGNQTTQSIFTGIAGYVIQKKEQFIYTITDDNSHAKLNPQVDLSPLEHTMVTIPILDNDSEIIGCLQLILGPKSPTIAGTSGEKMHFGLAAHWLSHQISAPLQFAIKSLSSPMTRDLTLPLPSSPLTTPKTSRKGLNSPKTPDNSRKRDSKPSSSSLTSSSTIPVAVFEQLQSVHIQTQSDLEACREKLVELGNMVEKLTESEKELKEDLTEKGVTIEKLEAELLTVMESESAVRESLDGFLEKQKKRRESHLASDRHSHQLTEEEADDEYIEKRVNMVEIKYKDLIKSLEHQIHELTASLTKEHHHESMMINEKNERIVELELELSELKVQAGAHHNNKINGDTITTLEAKVAELRGSIHVLNNEKVDYENTISNLTNDAKKFNEMIAQRDLIIESMNDTHDTTTNNDNNENDEMKKLKDIISQKDDVIKILQDQISKLAQNMADEGQPRVIGDWSENFDEQGNSYWVNMVTGESSWELPA